MSLLLAFLLAALLFFVTITLILFFIGPIMLLQPKRRTAAFYRNLGLPVSPEEINVPYEEIIIRTNDGLKLNSWLLKAPSPAKGTILYLHGVGDCKIDGLRFAKLMHDHHFNVFLYDARRHGQSEGTYCTYGYDEKYDVLKIIDYLQSRTDMNPGKIGIFGTSMGAAVALQAAALDARIAGVAAENPFATLRTIFDDYQKRLIKLPFHYLRNIVIVRSELMAKFKASDVSPLEAVRNITIPILIIYGTMDHLIKYQYSIMLYEEARAPKELFPVENASHSNIWQIAGERYESTLLKFFERTLA